METKMKTEISRSFTWGYALSEQELRRIVQTCLEHLLKIGIEDPSQHYEARLRDGAIFSTKSIDDILSLENGGSRTIERLTIRYEDEQDRESASIEITYQDGQKNRKNWTSISYSVTGPSRDWAFVAASELDDRVKRTKKLSLAYWLNHRVVSFMLAGATFVSFAIAIEYLRPKIDIASQLERAYKQGQLNHPIEAMIFVERAQARNQSPENWALMMLTAFSVPPLIVFGLAGLLSRVHMPYVFYWGDQIHKYDRARSHINVFWIVIVLGLLVSIAAGLLTNYLSR